MKLKKKIAKIKYPPQKDQKDITSKNDPKSRLGALNQNL